MAIVELALFYSIPHSHKGICCRPLSVTMILHQCNSALLRFTFLPYIYPRDRIRVSVHNLVLGNHSQIHPHRSGDDSLWLVETVTVSLWVSVDFAGTTAVAGISLLLVHLWHHQITLRFHYRYYNNRSLAPSSKNSPTPKAALKCRYSIHAIVELISCKHLHRSIPVGHGVLSAYVLHPSTPHMYLDSYFHILQTYCSASLVDRWGSHLYSGQYSISQVSPKRLC